MHSAEDDAVGNLLAALYKEHASSNLLPEAIADDLLTRFAHLNVRHSFSPGDLIEWKPGLRTKNAPEDNHPAVVIEAGLPFINDGDAGSGYFHEPLDISAACIMDGAFVIFHFDSRRMQPYTGPRLSVDA